MQTPTSSSIKTIPVFPKKGGEPWLRSSCPDRNEILHSLIFGGKIPHFGMVRALSWTQENSVFSPGKIQNWSLLRSWCQLKTRLILPCLALGLNLGYFYFILFLSFSREEKIPCKINPETQLTLRSQPQNITAGKSGKKWWWTCCLKGNI